MIQVFHRKLRYYQIYGVIICCNKGVINLLYYANHDTFVA